MYALTTRENDGKREVWDEIRRKWLVLTPEEHVRQCLVLYLMHVLEVPKGLISLEKGLRYNSRMKRYDAVVYDRDGSPFLLCECKAPHVSINEETVFQSGVYQHELQAKVLLLTNGRVLMAEARDEAGNWKGLKLPENTEGDGWRMFAEDFFFEY